MNGEGELGLGGICPDALSAAAVYGEPPRIGLDFERLEKLLAHLEAGRLSVDRFDFGVWRAETSCGTCGCAGGEVPAIWPESWELRGRQFPVVDVTPCLKGHEESFLSSAEYFFGLTFRDACRLFTPTEGGLGKGATLAEVAAFLRAFIDEKKRVRAAGLVFGDLTDLAARAEGGK